MDVTLTTPIERRPARTQGQRGFALALMTTAGWCDAAGFLLFGGLFVSFMSGDATRLGQSAGEAHWMAAARFLAARATFLLGIAFGRSVRLGRPDRGRRDLLVANAALLADMRQAVERWLHGALAGLRRLSPVTDTLAPVLGPRLDFVLPAARGRADLLSMHAGTPALVEALLAGSPSFGRR